MQAKPFFSVVMPVYNVESYLEEAIQSVLSQTFSDFELILVDDCSPDGSAVICDRFAALDARVQVLHLSENVGLSYARNAGLSKATGTYISFMDSDDTIEPTVLQEVYASLEENDADMVVFGLKEDYCDADGAVKNSFSVGYDMPLFCKTRDEVQDEVIRLEQKTLLGYAWNKFYRLENIRTQGLAFQKITLIEDILFNIGFVKTAEKINILSCTPYHYMKRVDGSLTAKFVPDYYQLHRQRVQALLDLYISWNKDTDEVRRVLADIFARYIFSALQRNCDKRAQMTFSARRKFLKQLYSQDALYKELLPSFGGSSAIVRVFVTLLRKQNIFGCLLLGRIIYIVKTYFPQIFSKAKQNR